MPICLRFWLPASCLSGWVFLVLWVHFLEKEAAVVRQQPHGGSMGVGTGDLGGAPTSNPQHLSPVSPAAPSLLTFVFLDLDPIQGWTFFIIWLPITFCHISLTQSVTVTTSYKMHTWTKLGLHKSAHYVQLKLGTLFTMESPQPDSWGRMGWGPPPSQRILTYTWVQDISLLKAVIPKPGATSPGTWWQPRQLNITNAQMLFSKACEYKTWDFRSTNSAGEFPAICYLFQEPPSNDL